MEEMQAKPFLKWAGGKKALLPELFKFIPLKYNRYFEPFLGSGALFFVLNPKEAYLSDLNRELINTFIQIKYNVEAVIQRLSKMSYNKKSYYKVRNQKLSSSISRASRFIYLNKTCWNGLYRENSKGEFNVPMGRYKRPLICDEYCLRKASIALKATKILKRDFKSMLEQADQNDLVYLDPPYVTGHKNNGFIEYNAKIFSWSDQKRLSEVIKRLDKRKCKVILSNADHASIKEIYSKFNIHYVQRKSLIAGDCTRRKSISELIITNF